MIRFLKYYILLGLLGSMFILSSCSSSKKVLYNPKEVSELSYKLGIDISNTNKEDDKYIPLYAEVSQWLGVPYRYGGITKKGVDCSGLAYQVYKKVYRKDLPRSTSELAKKNIKNVSKEKLNPGDLVFFATTGNKKKISHVGIYLKDGYFIHASSRRGVVVSNLSEDYYKKAWKKGGRPL